MSERIIESSIAVAAPPAVVFAIVADPRQHPRIDGSGTVRGVITGPERLERGSEFGVDMTMFGLRYRIRNRVVEFEPDALIAWRHFGGHRWRYRLVPSDVGTTVTESFDYRRSNRLARVIITLLGQKRRNRRSIPATLQRLKHAAEADALDPLADAA